MIFITGATGFLGSHLLHDLVMLDKPVRALYRNSDKMAFVQKVFGYYSTDVDSLMERIEWVQGDLLDYSTLTEYLKGADQVYHCAGLVSFDNAYNQKMADINLMGTGHIVNACLELNIPRLCHVSSIASLGISQDGEIIDENRLWNQDSSASPYSVSKFRGEMEVWRGIHEGLNAVIVNPSVIIGPGMWYRSVPGLFQQIYKGVRYFPTGASGYVDVRDVVRNMIRLANSEIKGERFIISAENKTHREIFNYFAEGMHRPLPTRPLNPFMIKMACNLEKLRSLIMRKPLRITKRSMQSAATIFSYSNQKITKTLSVEFIPVRESIAYSSLFFTKEMQAGRKILSDK